MGEGRQFTTFYLAGSLFGVSADTVHEILRSQEMTPVPLAPPEVSGLINLRGQIVTAIDLRRLGMKARERGKLPVSVVVRSGGGLLSLLVDEIGDVVEAPEDTFQPPPETLGSKAREIVRGVHKLDNHLLQILDIEALSCEREVEKT